MKNKIFNKLCGTVAEVAMRTPEQIVKAFIKRNIIKSSEAQQYLNRYKREVA